MPKRKSKLKILVVVVLLIAIAAFAFNLVKDFSETEKLKPVKVELPASIEPNPYFEDLLTDYFNSEDLMTTGLPSVEFVAEKLNVSQNYLSGLLKSLTGQSTQQHIHEKLIAKAKEKLGWEPTGTFEELVKLMVDADLKALEETQETA